MKKAKEIQKKTFPNYSIETYAFDYDFIKPLTYRVFINYFEDTQFLETYECCRENLNKSGIHVPIETHIKLPNPTLNI